jgi:hypothetical protein
MVRSPQARTSRSVLIEDALPRSRSTGAPPQTKRPQAGSRSREASGFQARSRWLSEATPPVSDGSIVASWRDAILGRLAAGTPTGVQGEWDPGIRWCRCAQPPATGFHASGMPPLRRSNERPGRKRNFLGSGSSFWGNGSRLWPGKIRPVPCCLYSVRSWNLRPGRSRPTPRPITTG